MPIAPKLSETEWKIMRVLWAEHPSTSATILKGLQADDASWHPKTFRTLLARLVKKKAVGFSSEGRTYLYRPLVLEEACRAVASQDFIDRIFGGSLKPMLAYFVEQRKVSREDLAELTALLEGKAKKGTKCKPHS